MTQAGRNEDKEKPVQLGASYAQFQLAKAFAASARATDAKTHERAGAKAASWLRVIENLMTGSVDYGTRTPIKETPPWATLEVITGGFATGGLLAAGPLLGHELAMLQRIGPVRAGEERATLNAYFLSDDGLAELQDLLRSGRYEITIPEEGALLMVAWLVSVGHADRARTLLDELTPFFNRLRFYPAPGEQAVAPRSVVYVQDVPGAVKQLKALRPHAQVLAQKEALEVWAPYLDRMVALFLETIRDDWPCQVYPDSWERRGRALLNDFIELRKAYPSCRNPQNQGKHFAQLHRFLEQTVSAPQALTGRDVARIRTILKGYTDKRDAPGSDRCASYRETQARSISAPMHYRFAEVIAARAAGHVEGMSADDIARVTAPITEEEVSRHAMPAGTPVPDSIRRKLLRCLADTVEELTRKCIITSGEVLAEVLPQITSHIRAQSVDDEQLRPLYAGVYRAFRRRRSLLLLNLQKQVQLEELPWISAIVPYRTKGAPEQDVSLQALTKITATAVGAFPYAILPNKLLQELKALAKGAGADLPLVEELAADIFMGQFSTTFVNAMVQSAKTMEGSLYATYYGIDYQAIMRELNALGSGDAKGTSAAMEFFAATCSARAGVARRSTPAANGMVIEQQQILTTQNLASVFSTLQLRSVLENQLFAMSQECFRWVCRRQQVKIEDFHARLIMLKNTAYAWRQMIFFLSLQPERVPEFLQWATEHFQKQSEPFRVRFEGAMIGLELASMGQTPPSESLATTGARRFLGWSSDRHWLMPKQGS